MEAVALLLIEKITVALGTEAMKAINTLLEKEVALLAQLPSTMNRIKREFVVMKAFLKHLDAQKEKSSTLEAWLEQVRKVAFHVEDVIDEYSYLIGKQYRSGFIGSIHNHLHRGKHIFAWRQLAAQLQQIEEDLRQVSEMRNRYDIRTSESSHQSSTKELHRADSSYVVGDDELVGVKEERAQLVEWLKDGKPPRGLVSIWGMGGLGKTTLVTNVYKSKNIQQHFDCHAWVSVSQNYGIEELLRKILSELLGRKQAKAQEIDIMTRRNLVETLQTYLKDKKYIIILDDVWSTDAWYGVDAALIDSKQGSRIVITTRNKDVASLASKQRILELQSLQPEEAWHLFCRKAFWNDEENKCRKLLEPVAEKIVEKCQGLPLAIVAVGSLLSLREMNELEWQKVNDHLCWELTDNPHLKVRHTLNLSFTYLPDYLKSCFLYCSIFPEDYLIKKKRLIRLWVAEGFIEEKGTKTMEELAEEYLNELIHRCMLQVVDRNDIGRVRSCRMHDLMRELNISMSKTKRFSISYDDKETTRLDDEARRLSIQNVGHSLQLTSGLMNLRSFFVFDTSLSLSSLTSVLSTLRLLRVLDLQDVPIQTLPAEVYNLFNLHYLGLRKTKVKELPQSIGRLRNLQTLDVAQSNIEELPRAITEVKMLRNLVVQKIHDPTAKKFNDVSGVQAPKGLWELKGLQTLQYVEANRAFISQIWNLTQLRSLRIMKVRRIHCAELCTSITKMHFLTKLAIMAFDEAETLGLDALSPPPQLLEKLALKGRLEKGVESALFRALSSSLKYLYLGWSGLKNDPLPSLSHMSNLILLCLNRAYEGTELKFYSGWFPKLKALSLAYMEDLEWLEIQQGSLENLARMELIHLKAMKGGPIGIQFLKSLKELDLLEMPKRFTSGLQGINGGKVQHIPEIIHVFQREGEWFTESLSQHGSSSSVDIIGAYNAHLSRSTKERS